MKSVRFLPIVALAAFSLLALKLVSLGLGEGYMITGSQSLFAQTEKVGKAAEKPATGEKKSSGENNKKTVGNKKAPVDVTRLAAKDNRFGAETRLLAGLSERRKQLDERERRVELRENLLKAAQKKLDERVVLLKKLRASIDSFTVQQKQQQKGQFAKLVKMYSSMKPAGAARIFNDLDSKVLLGIIEKMKPSAMSAILAAMEPAKAREMTISLAGAIKKPITPNSLEDLPKIEGK